MNNRVWSWLKTRNKRYWAITMAWLRVLGYAAMLYLQRSAFHQTWWQLAALAWLLLLAVQYVRILRAPFHGRVMWTVFFSEILYVVWLTAHITGMEGGLLLLYALHISTIIMAYEQLEAALMLMIHQGAVLVAYYNDWISGDFLAAYLACMLLVAAVNFWQWEHVIRERHIYARRWGYQRLGLQIAEMSTRILQHQVTAREYLELIKEMAEHLCGLPGGVVFGLQAEGSWEKLFAFGIADRAQEEIPPLPRGMQAVRIEQVTYVLGELQGLPSVQQQKRTALAPLFSSDQVPEPLSPEQAWRLARIIEMWQQSAVLQENNQAYVEGLEVSGTTGKPVIIEQQLDVILPQIVLKLLAAATGARQAYIMVDKRVIAAIDDDHAVPVICLDQNLEALLLLAQSREEGILVNNLAVLGLWAKGKESCINNVMIYPLRSNQQLQGYLVLQNKWGGQPFSEEEWLLGQTVARNLGLNLGIKNFVAALLRKKDEVYRLLAATCQAYVPFLRGHLERTAVLAEKMALTLGLPQEQARKIWRAGLVHDIGMLAIDRQLLTKPGPLSTLERNLVQDHVKTVRQIFQNQGLVDREIVEMIVQHHERWDGQGYPEGLRREEISLGARILAVAEAYDAMLNFRHYQPQRSLTEALEELMREAGQQFDPLLVDVLINIIIEEERKKGNNLMRDIEWVQQLAREVAVAASRLSGGDQNGNQGVDISGPDGRSSDSPGGGGAGLPAGGTGRTDTGSK